MIVVSGCFAESQSEYKSRKFPERVSGEKIRGELCLARLQGHSHTFTLGTILCPEPLAEAKHFAVTLAGLPHRYLEDARYFSGFCSKDFLHPTAQK